jgi:hypothetical protein
MPLRRIIDTLMPLPLYYYFRHYAITPPLLLPLLILIISHYYYAIIDYIFITPLRHAMPLFIIDYLLMPPLIR